MGCGKKRKPSCNGVDRGGLETAVTRRPERELTSCRCSAARKSEETSNEEKQMTAKAGASSDKKFEVLRRVSQRLVKRVAREAHIHFLWPMTGRQIRLFKLDIPSQSMIDEKRWK